MNEKNNYPKICPICRIGKKFVFIRDFTKEQVKYYLYQCFECYVQFWFPQTIVDQQWYEEKGNPYNVRDLAGLKISRGYHKFFLKRHKNLPKGIKVLDLGCGTAEFLAELEKIGHKVYGLDFDREAVKIAKGKFCLKDVYPMSFKEFFQKKDLPKFDIITFFEVIEHLPDPENFILNVKKLLKPGGKIIFSTPYRERILPDLNAWDFPPHHWTRWNEKSINNFLKNNGFAVTHLGYVEGLKILSESVSGKFKTRLVGKFLKIASERKKSLIIPKVIYFLGKMKDLVLGKIPALFLWILGKAMKRKNGIIYVEARTT